MEDQREMSVREWALGLREEHGMLTPAIVLEAARPEDSPAHGYVFNIPVEEAAEEYYLERAHKLIRSVRIVIQPSPQEPPRHVRFFVAIPGEEDAFVYEPITEVVNDPEKMEEARKAAERRLRDAEASLLDLNAAADDDALRMRARTATRLVKRAREHLAASGT